MTHTKDEALKLALEALERISTADDDCDFLNVSQAVQLGETIDAIKQALEQPVQEPVAWMHTMIEDVVVGHRPADLNVHPDRWMPLYKDPTPCQTCEALARTVMMDQTAHDTTPPAAQPAVPITESEIEKMWFQQADFPTAGQRIVGFARAIEAKLKEKNSD